MKNTITAATFNDDVVLSTNLFDRRDDIFGIWCDTFGAGVKSIKVYSE